METSGIALTAGHFLLRAVYVVLPLLAIAAALTPGPARAARVVRLGALALLGLAVSVSLSGVYAYVGDGRIRWSQVVIGAYFTLALVLLLRGLDRLALLGLAVVLHPWLRAGVSKAGPGRAGGRRDWPLLRAAALCVRGGVLVSVGLPWVMAACMVYRVKVSPVIVPETLGKLYAGAEEVRFTAMDGLSVSAWYLPPTDAERSVVVLAHGLGSNKGNQLVLTRRLREAGWGVLAIDLRAHGMSGGQLTTFGVTERYDVLGAVRWLRSGRGVEKPVVVVGVSQGGAAALLAAATDSPEGRSIGAVAVVSSFGDLGAVMEQVSREQFPGPLGYLVRTAGFPLAELHAGVRLRQFRPMAVAGQLWPRPLLVIHGTADELISIRHGRQLFHHAGLPKFSMWVANGTHTSVVFEEAVALELERFFASARPEPIVGR